MAGGIYLHIPYCRRRCGYCAFYSAGLRLADWDAFLRSLEAEMQAHRGELTFCPTTIYIGGGTPSLIPADKFGLLSEILSCFSGTSLDKMEEMTIEVNPDDVDEWKADAWSKGGVSRVSMGVQSFDADELRLLGRTHEPAHVGRALQILRERFSNISIDLIYSLPGQTVGQWRRNLEQAAEAGVDHLSLYSLTFEEKSELTLRRDRKIVEAPDEELGAEMNTLNDSFLEAQGFHRYETSNFARPGFESRHNTGYWTGLPYLGFGPSASSYDGVRHRRTNAPDLKHYLAGDFRSEEESLTDEELREEYLLTRLRLADGLKTEQFAGNFGERELYQLLSRCRPYIESGLLNYQDGWLSASAQGLYQLDDILVHLI